jgi:hypothetical protein
LLRCRLRSITPWLVLVAVVLVAWGAGLGLQSAGEAAATTLASHVAREDHASSWPTSRAPTCSTSSLPRSDVAQVPERGVTLQAPAASWPAPPLTLAWVRARLAWRPRTRAPAWHEHAAAPRALAPFRARRHVPRLGDEPPWATA